MIRLNALELLEMSGHIEYWLYKQTGMSYQNLMRMLKNKTKSIHYENIEVLCQLFNCSPNELFILEFDEYEKPNSNITAL